jgi:hypothetical protein
MNGVLRRLKNLTLFDYIVGGLFLLGVIIFAVIFFRKPTYISVTVKVGEEDIVWPRTGIRDWYSQLFYPGMNEKDSLGKIQAEVTEISTFDTVPGKKALYLTLRLRAVYEKASNQYTFKGKPLLVGFPIKLQLDSVNIEGLITNIEGVRDLRQRVSLLVEAVVLPEEDENVNFLETKGVPGYIADAIKIGDKVYDNKKNAVITVVNKKVENAKKVVATSSGQVIVGANPLLRDVYLTLEIEAIENGGKYYLFDDQPILIGETIPFNLPTLSIFPVVTKITDRR